MSTDLYGVRVLDLAQEERRVQLRVFSVYYDWIFDDDGRATEVIPAPAPQDASFFLRVLWDKGDTRFGAGGPIGDAVTATQICREAWVNANAARFVERVHQLSVRNDPPGPHDWHRLHDFYYERDGRWQDEDLLLQADYDLWVADRRWSEHLSHGLSWGTTAYATCAEGFQNTKDPRGLWSATRLETA